MKNEIVRLVASGAFGVSLFVAGSTVAFAQTPLPTPTPPPVEPTPPPVEPVPPPAVEMPAPVVVTDHAADAKSPIGMVYDKGIKFESEDGKFEMRLSLRSQLRWELVKPTVEGGQYVNKFSMPRGRLQLEGHLFSKDLIYKLEFSFADKQGFAFTKDFWLEQQFSDGKMGLRVGQFKGPFNRQELVSDFASEFNERAITAKWVQGGRDLGVMLNNGYADKAPEGLEWSLGLFNAFKQGRDEVVVRCPPDNPAGGDVECPLPAAGVTDWDPAIFARVGFNQGAKFKGYSEGDLEGGPLRFGVGLSYKVDLAQFKKAGHESVGDNMQHGVGLDAALKVEGFDVSVGVFLMGFRDVDPGLGAHIQAGYFVVPKKAQVAARYAFIPNAADDEKQDIEARGAFNYYFNGHAWKWATDGGITKKGDADPVIEIRSMAQLTF